MIRRNGRECVGFGDSVFGFGDAGPPITWHSSGPLIIGALAGAAGGAILGAIVKKAAVGAVVGGLGGTIAVVLTAPWEWNASPPSTSPPTPVTSGWRMLSPGDPVDQGQTLAVAFMLPGGVPIPPEVAASLSNTLAATTALDAQMGFSRQLHVYLPGQQPTTDWPADDSLGSGAYRISLVAPMSDPFTPDDFTKMVPVPLTVTVWVK